VIAVADTWRCELQTAILLMAPRYDVLPARNPLWRARQT